jgi:hypothetical protein
LRSRGSKFTSSEIENAVKSLKNNKSPGIDNLNAELLKYGPEEMFEEISEIFNTIAETGETPDELTNGILIPIQKPGKKQGPPSHLRPIVLLSTLRKILSICMLNRIASKITNKIPVTQAAYQGGRSTTEHVFTFKCLCEKAITSKNYNIFIEMLDMSKAFDTVRRGTLFELLRHTLKKDELHIMKILINDVKLQVRIGNNLGEKISTNIGIPQGDCLSPVLFIFYLASALKENRPIENTISSHDHNYSKPTKTAEELLPDHLKDHSYTKKVDTYLDINQQYADDISWVTTAQHKIDHIKETIPEQLKKYNLHVNEKKTEEYKVSRNTDDSWKTCKYLGSLLDTEKDINRRKGCAITSYNKLNKIFKNKRVSTEKKVRTFNVYVSSIFLYNSELWTITKSLEQKIDAFQRSLLRKVLDIRWPEKISNDDLYTKTKEIRSQSQKIKKRRLSWLGHLLRLPEDTPARQALQEYLRHVKRPRGKPKTTWVSLIQKELKDLDETLESAQEKAANRDTWNIIIEGAMSKDE